MTTTIDRITKLIDDIRLRVMERIADGDDLDQLGMSEHDDEYMVIITIKRRIR